MFTQQDKVHHGAMVQTGVGQNDLVDMLFLDEFGKGVDVPNNQLLFNFFVNLVVVTNAHKANDA